MNHQNIIMGVPYMFSGVYGVYPGATTRPEQRPNEHLSALANGRHYNKDFQRSVNKHGIESFCYLSFEPVPFDKLAEEEQKLIDKAEQAGVVLFSKQRKLKKPHPVGYKLSAKTRKKQAIAKRGNKNAAKHFSFLSPAGIIFETDCLTRFCKEQGLEISAMSKVAALKQEKHRGWQCTQ